VVCTQKKKKTTESAVKQKTKKNNRRSKMNKLFLVLALLFALSACSVGKKCTYTQDGTKISSYVWFFQGDKPIDLDKNNCG
jgi:FtsH-binding integral membrane protein